MLQPGQSHLAGSDSLLLSQGLHIVCQLDVLQQDTHMGMLAITLVGKLTASRPARRHVD